MFIILEGVDGSGKSSLASDIAARIHKQYPGDTVHELHSGPLKTDPYTAYIKPFLDYKPGSGVHYVCDRLHVGERIYGPLYRGQSAITGAQWVWIEMWLASRGATLVHVTQTLETIRKRLAARGEDFLQDEHVEQVWRDFTYHTADTITHSLIAKPDGDNTDWVTNAVALGEIHETAAMHLPPSYVGSPHAPVLLVGDRRGGKPPYEYDGAFRPVRGNSGEYLLTALYHARDNDPYGYFWQDFGLINSASDEEPLLTRAVDNHSYVAALGKEASKRLYFKEHAKLPHPQYVRRFWHDRQAEYGKMLFTVPFTGEDMSAWPKS